MSTDKPAFVFIHGAWHAARSWDKVVPLLEAAGHYCVAIDLPGSGRNAAAPASFAARPFDPAAFGTGVEGAVDRYVAMTRATQELVVLTSD